MEQYIKSITDKFARAEKSAGSEMLYRADFENYLKKVFEIDGRVTSINHDIADEKKNRPDFVILKNNVPILYLETKDIGVDLNKIEKTEQLKRYFGYNNLILTDYLEFRFYRNGLPYCEPISIGKINKAEQAINWDSNQFTVLEKTLQDFTKSHKEPIKNGAHLAKIMGGKAQRIRDNVADMLVNGADEDLIKMKNFIAKNLVSTLDESAFADMYAQTLVYGLFAARYNDKTPDDFSRAEAQELVPKTNPFLRQFFNHIAGSSFPERLRFIVDELCEVFSYADINKLLHDFYGKEKSNRDPIIHFYEDFLREYDAKKKMEMGVFYTPHPIVDFIVRGVDDILKREFSLTEGLADTSKIRVKRKTYNNKGKLVETEEEIHKVQVLDIATGTGTFLDQVVRQIYKAFEGQQGRWESYVEKDLLPRLHGFELMMASYTIAHLKLGMTLHDTGAGNVKKRLGIYLTNTLEDAVDYETQGTLFGLLDTIAEESKEASRIKKEYPIMCVIGNPPYSGESMNPHYKDNGVYKVEPGGKEKLKERNSKWLNDDYVKFIRFAESLVEKNGEGIIGMITAHGYIDNPTFRGMRWHLRKTFDAIYVLDLHGNSNKKETALDGTKDENVFDIKTGVSIIFGVKKQADKNKPLATIYKADSYGKRIDKFNKLDEIKNISSVKWIELANDTDVWFKVAEGKQVYDKGFSVSELFSESTVGVVTSRDSFVIDSDKIDLEKRIKDFLDITTDEARFKYQLKDNSKWKVSQAQQSVFDIRKVYKISYRPFDIKYIYYDNAFIERSRESVMKNFLVGENVGLNVSRQVKAGDTWQHVLISENLVESSYVSNKTSEIGYVLPLYIFDKNGNKVANLSENIVKAIEEKVDKTVPENILDFVYAVLHHPTYRKKYGEFLKSDFPCVPYPTNKDIFWNLVELGQELRKLHLMQSPESQKLITTYPEVGDNIVEKPIYKDENVQINDTQYFGNVPEAVWNFYIGGYQPAQKYLKDRKGHALTSEEILHWQKIVTILDKTIKIMAEIDKYDV